MTVIRTENQRPDDLHPELVSETTHPHCCTTPVKNRVDFGLDAFKTLSLMNSLDY